MMLSRVPDAGDAVLDSLRAVTSQEAFEDLLFPDRVFEGMRNKDEAYQTILGNLETAWSDARTLPGQSSGGRGCACLRSRAHCACSASHCSGSSEGCFACLRRSKHRVLGGNSLRELQRCAICSDEAANTFETKMSDRESGIHGLRANLMVQVPDMGQPPSPTIIFS